VWDIKCLFVFAFCSRSSFFLRPTVTSEKGPPEEMKQLKTILGDIDIKEKGKYVTKEYQDYGLRLAHELGDERRKSLYIKLAKEVSREVLEEARAFVKDQSVGQVKSRARLFMWKLSELRRERKERGEGE
jgi:hypothetical protein